MRYSKPNIIKFERIFDNIERIKISLLKLAKIKSIRLSCKIMNTVTLLKYSRHGIFLK